MIGSCTDPILVFQDGKQKTYGFMFSQDKFLHSQDKQTALHSQLGRHHLYYVDDLSVNFGNFKALSSIQLTIATKEILFITGPSGAGKTTLLNVLAGNVKQYSGRVIRPKGQFVSQVFQDLRLISNQSCLENLWLAYDSSVYKNKDEFQRDLSELCRVLGVTDRLGVMINNANGGLKQKIAMIRALLAKPSVLMADEPSAALDKDSAMKMFEILDYLNRKRGLTVIWATHNRELVKQFSGRIIHLDKGKLIHSGRACFI